MALPQYPERQPFNTSWLHEVPKHWSVNIGKAVFKEKHVKNTGLQQEQVLSLSYGRILKKPAEKLHGLVPASFEGYQIIEPGDVIMRSIDLQNDRTSLRFGIARDHGIITSAYLCLQVKNLLSEEYAYQVLNAYDLMKVFYGFGSGLRQNINFSDFRYLPIPVPPRAEQDQIVAYLRAQDAHIARFIQAKRELIRLLAEQKQTIIEGAVTQGLDAATEKRDSDIDWMTQIPAHWETCKLKHVAMFNPSRSESTAFRLSDASVSFLPMECITTDGKLQRVENRKTSEVWEGYTYFRRNDVVMAKITPCFENGKGGLLDTLPTEIGFGTTEFIVLRAAERRIRPAFLAKLLSLRIFRVLGADAMTGAAGQQRVPLSFVKNFEIALPPLDEQDQILDVLQTATADQDVAIERIRSEIALIREYRDRLIADVVTGQVDVRGWQPDPEDVVDDALLAALGDDSEDTPDGEDADGNE